jgi:hypothetical protein
MDRQTVTQVMAEAMPDIAPDWQNIALKYTDQKMPSIARDVNITRIVPEWAVDHHGQQ